MGGLYGGRMARMLLLVGALAVLGGCPDVPPVEGVAPVAAFSAAPLAGVPGVAVQFSDESEAGSDPIVEWLWVFGDGGMSEEQHPSHVYAAAGRYSVGLTVRSAAGEDTATAAELIVVLPERDTTPPVITLYGSERVTVECGTVWVDPGATAVDAEELRTAPLIVGGDVVKPGTPGVYAITYDAVDGSGNAAAQRVRTVTVVDSTPPAIVLNGGDVELACGGFYLDPGVVVSEGCDGAPAVTVEGAVDVASPGMYTLIYSARDAAGNVSAPVTRQVMVVDEGAPAIRLNGGDVLLDCSEAYNEAGATALDACDGEVAVAIESNVSESGIGVYAVTYTAADAAGNVATLTRSVRRVDRVAPVITMVGGDLVVECGTGYSDPGASAVDNCDGSVAVQASSAMDTRVPGAYLVSYDALDASGNAAAQQTRRVTLVDTTPPVIVLVGGDMMLDRGYLFSDPGAAAEDACSGVVGVTVEGEVDVHVPGNYLLQYRAEDEAGNAAEVTREVTVIEHCTDTTPWSRIYGKQRIEELLYKAIQTRDCGFLYLVRDDDSGYVLWKTDHAGDLLWQRSISFDGAIDYSTYHSPVDVVELPNGDLYVLGQRVRNAPIFALISVVALRLSAEGELIEQIEYPGIENFQALMALVADSGDVYLAGARIPSVIPSGSDYIMVVARLRGYGEPEWIVELEQGLPDYLAQAENGDLLVVGDTWSTLVDGVYIGQVASDGAVIREHRIAEAGAGRLNGFSLLSDGGYLLSMDESWFFKQYPTSRLVRLDGNGDVLWTRVAEFNAGFDVYGPSVAADDGGAVIGGTRGTFDRSDFQTDFFVEKVDTEGNTLWRRDYGGFAADLARFLIGTAEGGYLLAGESSSFDDACTVDSFGLDECEDLWALKLDADGNAPTEPEMQDTPGWVAGYWADPGLTDGALTVRTDGPGYVAAANSVYSPYDTCYLFAVDGTGVPEWVQPVTVAAGSPRLRRVIALEDGGYGVVGSVYKTINGLMVVRLAQDGSELWRYAPEATVSTEAYDLAETDDGGLIVVGSYYDASAEAGGRYAGYLVRLSANGDEVWRKWEPGAELARIVAIEPAPDGYDLLVNEKVDGVWRSRLVEVDRDGVVLDGHPIPHELGLELTDLLPIDTGGWILGGRTYTDTNWSDGVIVRMSAAGEVVWSVAPETYSSSEVSLAKLPDGNVLAAGRANYGMLLDVWTVEGEFVSRNTVAAADTNGGRGKLVVQEEGIAGIGRGNLPWGYGSRAVIFQADLHGITDREITHYELD